MTIAGLLMIAAWWVLLALVGWALCRSAGRADAAVDAWARERACEALEGMGEEAGAVVIEFPFRNGHVA